MILGIVLIAVGPLLVVFRRPIARFVFLMSPWDYGYDSLVRAGPYFGALVIFIGICIFTPAVLRILIP